MPQLRVLREALNALGSEAGPAAVLGVSDIARKPRLGPFQLNGELVIG